MFASTFGLRDPDRRFAPSGMMTLDFFSVALLIAKIVATRGSELARESSTRATAKIASKLAPTHCMTRLETRSARRPDGYRLTSFIGDQQIPRLQPTVCSCSFSP